MEWVDCYPDHSLENSDFLTEVEEAIQEIDFETEDLIRAICAGVNPSEVIPTFVQR